MNARSPHDSHDRVISLADLIAAVYRLYRAFVRERRLFRVPLLATGAIGLVVALGSRPEYTATERLLPYSMATASSNRLLELAGSLQGSSSGDLMISSALYPQVLGSFEFQRAVGESFIALESGERMTALRFFADRYRPSLVDIAWRYTFGLPYTLLSWLGTRAVLPDSSRQGSSAEPGILSSVAKDSSSPRYVAPEFRKLVDAVGTRISVSTEKSGVISVVASMPDPVAAAELAHVASKQLTATVIEFEVRKATDQLRYLNAQYIDAKERYEAAQRALASFADRNRMLSSATAQIERERLERDVNLAFETYQQFAREREQARIKLNRDTPVFTTLEDATVPTNLGSALRLKIVVFWLFLGVFASLGRIFWRELLSSGVLLAVADAPPPVQSSARPE